MTHSPPSSKPGSKASVHTHGPKPGPTTPTTTSRTKPKPLSFEDVKREYQSNGGGTR